MVTIIENFISDWLKDILVVFIVISFLEIILPKGKMKKFANFIIGLLLIFVIISPFTDLGSIQFNVDLQTNEYINDSSAQGIIEEQEEKIMEVFTNSIKEEIINLVYSNTNYEVVNVNIDIKEEEETIIIENLSLIIEEKNKNMGDIGIEQIKILESSGTKNDAYVDMANLIADYLGVDRNIVYISEID